MSSDTTLTRGGLFLRILAAVAIVIGAGLLGALLGQLTAPNYLPQTAFVGNSDEVGDGEAPVEGEATSPLPTLPPPLYLHLGIGEASAWTAVEQEITYAAAGGLHRYIVPVDMVWDGNGDLAATLESLRKIRTLDGEAEFVLQLSFNPPAAWYDDHADARMAGVAGDEAVPSPASSDWLTASLAAFDGLLSTLQEDPLGPSVTGFILTGLRQGRWQGGESVDDSEANVTAYRTWLERMYPDEGALKKAWGRDDATAAAAVPVAVSPGEGPASSFLRLEEDGPAIDYARYRAVSIAEAIAALASHIREKAGEGPDIWTTYGYSFEMATSATGHLAMTALLDSDLTGFFAPVSLVNRGLGASGGFMGPIHTAKAHGKSWVIYDDTRTGLAWNDETGQVEQMRELRPEDVYKVQRRNFALAAVYGLGLAWSDPQGRGALCSEAQWSEIQGFQQIYEANVDYPGSRLEVARQTYPEDAPVPEDPTLLVILDEEAQFLVNDNAELTSLLPANRDEIMKAGVSTEFCLMQDFLDNRTSQARVYLFLNAYAIPSDQRAALHARFAEEEATAIWVYAPGYRDVTLMSGNISDTVGMAVKALDAPSGTGSIYTLGGGHWLDEQQAIGTPRAITPLFYIDDEESDVLARFKQSDKPSIAMRTMEAGWTSIYIADPELSAPMLRELFRILEQQVYFRPGQQRFFDVTSARQNLIAIHASNVGERMVNLGRYSNIQDLFDEKIGWPQKESFVLNMETGETRLLQLSLP